MRGSTSSRHHSLRSEAGTLGSLAVSSIARWSTFTLRWFTASMSPGTLSVVVHWKSKERRCARCNEFYDRVSKYIRIRLRGRATATRELCLFLLLRARSPPLPPPPPPPLVLMCERAPVLRIAAPLGT